MCVCVSIHLSVCPGGVIITAALSADQTKGLILTRWAASQGHRCCQSCANLHLQSVWTCIKPSSGLGNRAKKKGKNLQP